MTEPWVLIHSERAALADDLSSLSDEQWAEPSLCSGWTVRDVLAHMTATARLTPGKFFPALIGSGFRFNTMVDKLRTNELGSSGAETLDNFRSILSATTHPPGPTMAMVGEAVVHSADIRRPLGISRGAAPEAMTAAADFYKGSNLLIGAKRRIAGVALRASDVEWSTGSGPEVSGPMLSLLLAMVRARRGGRRSGRRRRRHAEGPSLVPVLDSPSLGGRPGSGVPRRMPACG